MTAELAVESSARSSSFYIAMRIMPKSQRQAMFEIYHFCRAVDDIADEAGAPGDKLRKLEEWRAQINAIYQGIPAQHLQTLSEMIKQFSLKESDFLAVIDGMEMDVNGPIFAPDFETLNLYCDRVACAAGRLSAQVFSLPYEDGLQLAYHLGNALQLTNILRDIDEDAEIGRLYLPKELLNKANIQTSSLKEILHNPELPEVCNTLIVNAKNHFIEADKIMQRYNRYQTRTPRIMSEAYNVIHTKLAERGFSYPRAPIRLSKTKIVYILLRNLIF